MSVWLAIPSKRPQSEAQACIDRWRARGYLVAMHRDTGDDIVDCDYLSYGDYQGYAKTVNALIRAVMKFDTDARWFIAAGDDISPDPTKRADEIADECETFFAKFDARGGLPHSHTFGVMQPTGDPWADSAGRMIERIAGSPWIGREFCERAYGGNGPYFEGYRHCFLDNEIMDVAKLLGVFWQRPDLTHHHAHWTRERRPMPGYLAEPNSPAHWQKYHALYRERKAAGFPGYKPLAAGAENFLAGCDICGSKHVTALSQEGSLGQVRAYCEAHAG